MSNVILADYQFGPNGLGIRTILPASSVHCRFCGALPISPAKRFRKEAHVFPHSLGNNQLFSDQECDACNGDASRLESDLSAFLTPLRFWSAIRGKRSAFKHKVGRDGEIRSNLVSDHKGVRELNIFSGDESIHVRRVPEGLSLSLRVGTYSMENVARSLARLAVFSMAEEDLSLTVVRDIVIPWVRQLGHLVTPMPFWYAFVPKTDISLSAFRVDKVSSSVADYYQIALLYSGAVLYLALPLTRFPTDLVRPPSDVFEESVKWTEISTKVKPAAFQEFVLNIAQLSGIPVPSLEDIRLEAYYLWLERGCPIGSELVDWFEAEKRLVFGQLSAVFGAEGTDENQ